MLVLDAEVNFKKAIQQEALCNNLDWKVHPAKKCPRTSAHTDTQPVTFFLLSTLVYLKVNSSCQLNIPSLIFIFRTPAPPGIGPCCCLDW